MPTLEIESLLNSGIRAMKAGNRLEAKKQLLQVVELDDQHELAWLWLSTAVSEQEEQIICLENVLTINPHNEKAQQRLEKLRGILTIIDETSPPSSAYQAYTNYDDVWAQNVDLCPYCAAITTAEEINCPQCNKLLHLKSYRYPKASSRIHMLWIVLFGLANINLVQIFVDIIYWRDILGVITNGFLVGLFSLLAIGVALRKLWAFYATQIILSFVLLFGIFDFFFPLSIKTSGLPEMIPVIANVVNGLGDGFDSFLFIFEMSAAAIAIFLAVFFLAPDFERLSQRLVAKVGKKRPFGADYHLEAKRFAEAGMWATAVLYWQYAAALEPTRLLFQQSLANAYAKLNFFQRSLDVLQSAYQNVADNDRKNQLQMQINSIKNMQSQHNQQLRDTK